MTRKLLLVLCSLVCLKQVFSSSLTKEVNPVQNLEPRSFQQAFIEAVSALQNANFRQELIEVIFSSPEQAVANLADLLNRNSNPDVPEILDAFNAGLGTRLLVINEDNVQVDPKAFERLLSQNARILAKTLYPKDYFQQLMIYGTLQKNINQVSREIRPVIDTKRIPINRFTAVLSAPNHAISKRDISDIQPRDIISDAIQAVQITVCDLVITTIYNQVNATLIAYKQFLVDISVSSSDNYLQNVVASVIKLVIYLLEQAMDYINDSAESLLGSICTDLFSSSSSDSTSRRRRDILDVENDINSGTALVDDVERTLATRNLLTGLWELIWGLISPILNSVLITWAKVAITALQVYIDNIVQNDLATWIYSLINSIIPA